MDNGSVEGSKRVDLTGKDDKGLVKMIKGPQINNHEATGSNVDDFFVQTFQKQPQEWIRFHS